MKTRYLVALGVFALLALSSLPIYAGEELGKESSPQAGAAIGAGEVVTLDRCLAIALKRHPALLAGQGAVEASQSKVGQAEAGYYPQVNWTAGVSEISPLVPSSGNSSTKKAGTSTDPYEQYSSGLSVSQNIYDFGKTPTQTRIQSLGLLASRADLENVSAQVVLNVKQAYYGVLKAKRTREVTEETVRQFQEHLKQAKGFYEVGTKPKFDVTKAEVDLSNARLNLIRAENALRTALVSLNNAMGLPDAPEYGLEDNLIFDKYQISSEAALSRAYANRPDIRSLETKKQAAENAIELARKGFFPVVSGNAAYNWAGDRFPLEDGWSVGAFVTFPLFSGYLTTHQAEEARANLKVTSANLTGLRQTVALEVQQAFLNVREAEERIPTAELAVRQAKENLEIATGRYGAGVGSPIEVTDAQIGFANARMAHIQALYDYKTAIASLEKTMGGDK